MAQAVRSRKKALLEDRIEEFCQASAELLTNIHDRCGDAGGGKAPEKGKRGRKKKAKKETKESC